MFQERATADWLLKHNFGRVVSSFDDIAPATEALLAPNNYATYKRNVDAYDNRAAFEVVDILNGLLGAASPQQASEAIAV